MRARDIEPTGLEGGPHVRWYRAYRQHGHQGQLVEDLARYFRRLRLTDTVCGVRLERRARGEFYFFLAFDTEYFGLLPYEVEHALEACPLLTTKISGDFTFQEISGMVGGEMMLQALGQCVAYRQLRVDTAEDPFALTTSEDPSPTGKAEQLLWYLSALGSGSWRVFRSAAKALGFTEDRAAARLARSFRVLGHIETTTDGERWSVTRPAIVATPTPAGETLHFHAGFRAANTAGNRVPQSWGPDRLESLEGSEVLEEPAARITAVLPDLSRYQESLAEVGGVPTNRPLSKFVGNSFEDCRFDGEPGMYEVPFKDGRRMALLFDGERWRRGDWYGLRFLALWRAGLLPARYDRASWRLAIPADQRPPELFERPLILSSGLLPQRNAGWYVYESVTPEVAAGVCSRLCMGLEG